MSRTVLVLALLTCTLAGGSAAAFYVQARPPETPNVLRWASPTIEYRIGHTVVPGFEADQASLDTAIAAAFQTWQDVECSNVEFTAGDPIDNPTNWEHPEDHYILVYFIADEATATNAFFLQGSDQRSVAKYWFIYDNESYNIIASTIYINAFDYQWSVADAGEEGKLDVQSVVTAMIGRSLGLTSTVEGATTISGHWTTNDVERRTLETDDMDGITYLYPADGCATVEPEQICLGQINENCPPAAAGDGDADADADADADTDSDADSDADTDADTDADNDGDSDADGDADTGDDDGGCCSVAPGAATRHEGLAALGALGLALFALRRRSRRS